MLMRISQLRYSREYLVTERLPLSPVLTVILTEQLGLHTLVTRITAIISSNGCHLSSNLCIIAVALIHMRLQDIWSLRFESTVRALKSFRLSNIMTCQPGIFGLWRT